MNTTNQPVGQPKVSAPIIISAPPVGASKARSTLVMGGLLAASLAYAGAFSAEFLTGQVKEDDIL